MRFIYTELLLNAGLFTGRGVDITLLYIRSNSNTRGPLAVTMSLKSESPCSIAKTKISDPELY
jgi:hypothetical protein